MTKAKSTSHTYNAEKAREVFQAALDFLADAQNLLKELEARNHDDPR